MKRMDEAEFEDALDHYGTDLDRWPDTVKASGRELVRRSSRAAELLAASERLDDVLSRLPDAPASAGLKQAILNELPPDRWELLVSWFRSAFWRPVAAASLVMVSGFLLGAYQESSQLNEAQLLEELSVLAFSDGFEDLPYAE